MSVRFLILICLSVVGFLSCSDDGGTTIIPIAMGTVAPNVGGQEQPNQVYIDLNTNTATVVPRRNWDLGFSTDASFRVVLNGSTGMLTAATSETDFAEVSSANLAEFPFSQMNMDALFGILITPGAKPPWFNQAAGWADFPNGDINQTAFSEVELEGNPVYIVNRGKNEDGSARGFMKVLISRNGDGYNLVMGELDDVIGQTFNIEKDNDFNFKFVSMEQGEVTVEPKKNDWDISFSTYTDHVLSEFTSGFPVPYVVQDFIFLNRFEVGAQMISTTAGMALAEYEAFTAADLAAHPNYATDVDAIGTDWRTVATPQIPSSVTAPQDDRFYLVSDKEGTKFKILFTGMSNDTGERGFPEFIFEELR